MMLVLGAVHAWVWGESLEPMVQQILERAEFLRGAGVSLSPSISAFGNTGWVDRWGVGSLYSAFAFAPGFGLLYALMEQTVRRVKSTFVRLRLRLLLWILLSSLWLGVARHFSDSILLLTAGVLFNILSSYLLGETLKLIKGLALRFDKRARVWGLINMALLVLPLALHPAWHMLLWPEGYQGVDREALARDWILLDERGEHPINSWYYHFSPLAAERERVTVFQPPVIGWTEVGPEHWEEPLSRFVQRYGENGDWTTHPYPMKYLELFDAAAAVEALRRGHIDLWITTEEHVRRNEMNLRGVSRLAVVSHSPELYGAPEANPNAVSINASNWEGAPLWWSRGQNLQVISNPLLERVMELRDQGYSEGQNRWYRRFRTWLTVDVSRGMVGWMLPMLVLLGAACHGYRILGALCLRSVWPGLLLAALLLADRAPTVWRYASDWSDLLGNSPSAGSRASIRDMAALCGDLDHSLRTKAPLDTRKIRELLREPLSPDRRLAMREIDVFGRALRFESLEKDLRNELINRLTLCAERYASEPFNWRYKLLDAMAWVPELRSLAIRLARDEKHLYVRWYAENNRLF